MFVLQIEHPVFDFESWKKAFDSDPVGRERSGVRRYCILRPTDNPKYIMVDLEFDDVQKAEATQTKLRALWGQVEGKIMENARARIVEITESKEY